MKAFRTAVCELGELLNSKWSELIIGIDERLQLRCVLDSFQDRGEVSI